MALCITTQSELETKAFGERLGTELQGGAVVLLDGDLGAGKTQLAKGVARGLKIKQELTSPTFNLVLEYPLHPNTHEKPLQQEPRAVLTSVQPPQVLRHFDLYRLEQPEQLDDLDYFGLIEDEEAVSLVEWGSKFSESLPLDYLHVCIEQGTDEPEQRILEISAEGPRSQELLARLAAAAEEVHYD